MERASWGGKAWTIFKDCIFDGSRIRFNPSSKVKFIRCSFRNSTLTNWNLAEFKLIRCTFSGKLCNCMFKGRSDYELNAPTNIVFGNDFSDVGFIGSEFRWGVDLTSQRLPQGLDVFYAEDAPRAITAARARLPLVIDKKLREDNQLKLDILAEGVKQGQKQLFVTARTFPSPAWPTLRAVLAGDDPNNPPQPPNPTIKKTCDSKKTRWSREKIDPDITNWTDQLNTDTKTRRQQAADNLTSLLRDPTTSTSRRVQAAHALTTSLPNTGESPLAINLAGAILPANTTFTNTRFGLGSNFTNITAQGNLTITHCTFNGPAEFTDLTVKGTTTITYCNFNDTADFSRAELDGPTDFTETHFSEATDSGVN